MCCFCCFLETWKDIASICTSFIAILGVIGALGGSAIAYRTYKSNNSLRKIELMHKLYAQFLEEELYKFYEIVKKGQPFDLEIHKKVLNQSLTFFDEIECYYSQKLLDDEIWEYFAAEILNFSHNETIMKFVKDEKNKYEEKGFPPEIIPFSGFTELLKKVHEKYNIKKK